MNVCIIVSPRIIPIVTVRSIVPVIPRIIRSIPAIIRSIPAIPVIPSPIAVIHSPISPEKITIEIYVKSIIWSPNTF